MKLIKLTQGQFAKVDDDDFEKLNKFTWCVSKLSWRDGFYALTTLPNYGKSIRMHRMVTNAPKGMVVDHINGDTLDNRKENLRVCSQRENTRNKKMLLRNNTTGYTGVCKRKTKTIGVVYQAFTHKEGKFISLGSYKTPEEAYAVRVKVVKKIAKNFFGGI